MWHNSLPGWRILRRAMGTRRGSVAIMAAAMFPVVVAMAGLVVEYGNSFTVKTKLQQVADLAAYSGAIAYTETSSTTTMSSAASRIATLNGLSGSAATASLVTSPSGDGNQAVYVKVTGSVPLHLARVLSSSTQMSVAASAYAEVKSTSSACVIALNSTGTGVSLSGGTALTASACTVASNSSVSAPYGTSITSPMVTYNSAAALTSQTTADIHAPAGKTVTIKKAATTDPLNGNATVTAENLHLSSLALMSGPAVPNPASGTNASFAWSTTTMSTPGCTAVSANGTWTVTCVGNGPFNFGTVSLGGGVSLLFNVAGASTVTYNFSGDINASSGSTIKFAPGTYNIHGGIIVGGGVTVSFGAGTFNLGKLSASCGAGAGYSICNTGTSLTIAGPSAFSLAGGVYNAGGSILTLGTSATGNTTPTTNSFSIGSATDGNSLNMGGGAKTTFADASGAGDVFQMMGNLTTGGGSCLVLSAATNHDINGAISAAGGIYLGAGTWSVNGYVALGASSGGDVTCTVNGVSQALGMIGYNVMFGVAANTTPASGTCAGKAFCVGAGYGHVSLTAPISGSATGLAIIGPTSSTNTAGALFTEGASGTSVSGAFYLPNGSVTLSGGASVGSGAGQCLELIGAQVSLSGGAVLASSCAGLGGSVGTAIVLVQ